MLLPCFSCFFLFCLFYVFIFTFYRSIDSNFDSDSIYRSSRRRPKKVTANQAVVPWCRLALPSCLGERSEGPAVRAHLRGPLPPLLGHAGLGLSDCPHETPWVARFVVTSLHHEVGPGEDRWQSPGRVASQVTCFSEVLSFESQKRLPEEFPFRWFFWQPFFTCFLKGSLIWVAKRAARKFLIPDNLLAAFLHGFRLLPLRIYPEFQELCQRPLG